MIRDTAGQYFYAILLGPSGPVDGEEGVLTCTQVIDGDTGNEAPLADTSPTEVYKGLYRWGLSQPETNGHQLLFKPNHPNPLYSFVGQPSLVIYTREQTVDVGHIAGQVVNATTAVDFDMLGKIQMIAAILGNKVVPEPLGGGSYRLHFRNTTDTADLLILTYNPATGARTVG